MTSVLITGGAGFFGRAFTKRALDLGFDRICIYSRDEHKHALMQQQFTDAELERLRFFVGCVRDKNRMRRAMEGIDVVVHAAALKRIQTGHYDPIEMVNTNVGGSVNVIEAAMDANVNKVVALSSDKAFEPQSAYGHSKAMAESLFIAANHIRGASGPIFSCVRYGNVWNSTSSIVPTWRTMIAAGAVAVPVTDPNCTRFFMRIDQAVDLVLNTMQTMVGGEIAIPDLPAYRVGDLAEAMEVNMDIKGLPKFEKMHEKMSAERCSVDAPRMTVGALKEALHGI